MLLINQQFQHQEFNQSTQSPDIIELKNCYHLSYVYVLFGWHRIAYYILTVAYIMLALPTVLMNLSAILVFRGRNFKAQPSNLLIMSSTIADMLTGAIALPLGFTHLVFIVSERRVVCLLYAAALFPAYSFCVLSFVTVFYTSVDRYLAVFYPFFYTKIQWQRVYLLLNIASWLFTFGLVAISYLFILFKPVFFFLAVQPFVIIINCAMMVRVWRAIRKARKADLDQLVVRKISGEPSPFVNRKAGAIGVVCTQQHALKSIVTVGKNKKNNNRKSPGKAKGQKSAPSVIFNEDIIRESNYSKSAVEIRSQQQQKTRERKSATKQTPYKHHQQQQQQIRKSPVHHHHHQHPNSRQRRAGLSKQTLDSNVAAYLAQLDIRKQRLQIKKQEQRTSRITSLMLGSVCVCYLPYFIVITWWIADSDYSDLSHTLGSIAIFFVPIKALLNPVLNFYTMPSMKRKLKNILFKTRPQGGQKGGEQRGRLGGNWKWNSNDWKSTAVEMTDNDEVTTIQNNQNTGTL